MMLVKMCLNKVDKYELILLRNDFVGFLALFDRLKREERTLIPNEIVGKTISKVFGNDSIWFWLR